MSRFIADVQAQKFWEESITKENHTRLVSNAKLAGGGYGKSRQYEVNRKKIENGPSVGHLARKLPAIKPHQHRIRKINPLEQSLAQIEGLHKNNGHNLSSTMIEMQPPDKRTQTFLYDGFTKEGKGRYHYLKVRCQEIPETKFSFPLLSSWEYGWRLSDVIPKEDIKKPKYGRTRIVADTFYTRTGIPTLGY